MNRALTYKFHMSVGGAAAVGAARGAPEDFTALTQSKIPSYTPTHS